jgi:hypothetical protein
VRFTQEPVDMGPVTTASDDTCGNLIQIAHQATDPQPTLVAADLGAVALASYRRLT